MKNKTKTYVLGILVLGIWGTIGYKIVSGVNPSVPEKHNEMVSTEFTFTLKHEKDTFSIKPQSRDPFLGTFALPKKTNNKALTLNPKEEVNFPEVAYKGILTTQKSNDKIFIVAVNKKEYLLKKGQTVDRIKLVSGNSEHIVVWYNNTTQTIALK